MIDADMLFRAWNGVLSEVPLRTGFVLRDCLVLIAIRGECFEGAARCELGPPHRQPNLAHTVVALAARFPPGTDLVFVSYAKRPRSAPELMIALIEVMARAGIGVAALLWQSETHWGDYRIAEEFPVPTVRRDTAISATPAGMNADGSVEPSRFARHDAARNRLPVPAVPAGEFSAEHAEACLHVQAPEHAVLWVVAAVHNEGNRDELLRYWAFGDRRPHPPEGGGPGEPADFSELLGRGSRGPTYARVRAAIASCIRFRALVDHDARAAFWSIEGWMRWAIGESSLAMTCWANALDVQPRYRFAALMSRYVRQGAIPDWAFQSSDAAGTAHC